MPTTISFNDFVGAYTNTGPHNDAVFKAFTDGTRDHPLLARHRAHIEKNELGFGDPAFHFLWLVLTAAAAEKFTRVRCLEIGVFKGQVVSLWSLLAKEFSLPLEITAVTPLKGNPPMRAGLWRSLRYRLDRSFREQVDNGNFYPEEDYENVIRKLFATFKIDFDRIELLRGFSNAPTTLAALDGRSFELIYIDGDHTFQGVVSDLEIYGPKVTPGGWLVLDDASFYLPGTAFWKGHEAVSRACDQLADKGFTNVLNVGHNRVFQRNA